MSVIDRRRAERFSVQPAYTPCRLRRHDQDAFDNIGHVHDMSETGVRFESDTPLDPGTTVAIEIDLPERPGQGWKPDGPGRAVFLVGNVVWCNIDEPGPAVMAVATTRYCRDGDRGRMMRRLSEGGFSRVDTN
ncbi:MAG: hypothetical protein CMJ31_09535 [Phycisphaerae bacterium]|nr:hypothetical protein [Phycisphaerae bacterium]